VKITARISAIFAALFAVACFCVAITGFTSLGEITDAQQLDDARGFAWFWAFLGVVGVAIGAASAWIVRTQEDDR
jgi:hypothetical protein